MCLSSINFNERERESSNNEHELTHYPISAPRKPCSGYKLKEMNGSKIFAGESADGSSESGATDGNFNNRTSVRIVQVNIPRLLY